MTFLLLETADPCSDTHLTPCLDIGNTPCRLLRNPGCHPVHALDLSHVQGEARRRAEHPDDVHAEPWCARDGSYHRFKVSFQTPNVVN